MQTILPYQDAVLLHMRDSLRYTGPFIWSKLHNYIILADSLNAFKNKIRALDLSDVALQYKSKDCYLCRNWCLSIF